MSEHERRTPSIEGPRPQSPVSIVSRFSYEEHQDSNNGESSHPGRDSRASRRSSISASSQPSTPRIGLARPLSAAMISSNDRFTSSVTPDLARVKIDSTEQIFSVKNAAVTIKPCDQNEHKVDEGREQSMWNPFWLWRTTLLGFIFSFVLLVIILVVLYHFSNTYHGLNTQVSSNHYGWTYGPTAGGFLASKTLQ